MAKKLLLDFLFTTEENGRKAIEEIEDELINYNQISLNRLYDICKKYADQVLNEYKYIGSCAFERGFVCYKTYKMFNLGHTNFANDTKIYFLTYDTHDETWVKN